MGDQGEGGGSGGGGMGGEGNWRKRGKESSEDIRRTLLESSAKYLSMHAGEKTMRN